MQIVRNQGDVSEFDPRMLFSNNEENIRKALSSLIKTPGNNFLIHTNNTDLDTKALFEEINEILLKNRLIFDIILNFQRYFQGTVEDIRKLAESFKIEDIDKYEELLINNKNLLKEEGFITELMRFLISMTWRDLAFIINYVKNEDNDEINEILLKNGYKKSDQGFYKIGLIDIKLKAVQKLLEYENSHKKIDEFFLSTKNSMNFNYKTIFISNLELQTNNV